MHARPVRRILLRSSLIAALLAAPGPGTLAGEAAPRPDEKWPRSTPAEQQLDPAPLDRLVSTLRENREIRNVHSLLIVRNRGRDWAEERAPRDSLYTHILPAAAR